MPKYDGTGPFGAGSRTGQGRGLCGADATSSRFSWTGLLRGIGRGGFPWGGNRGRCTGGGGWRTRFGWASPPSSGDEAETLKAEIAALKEALSAMEGRLSLLNKKE
jgi:hypothetical protein